jgi:hypothetical protein
MSTSEIGSAVDFLRQVKAMSLLAAFAFARPIR